MRVAVIISEPEVTVIAGEVRRTVVAALERGGHTVTVLDLDAERFPTVMTAAQRRAYLTQRPIITTEVERSVEVLRNVEVLVFVYGSRLSTVPPRLKGWLEQVLVPGVAFVLDDSGRLRPGLGQVRRIIGVATHAESWWEIHRYRDAGRRTITRALRLNTGLFTRTGWTALYRAGSATAEQRTAFLSRLDHRLERL